MFKEEILNRTLEYLGETFPPKLLYSIIGEKIKVENKIQRDDAFGRKILRIAKPSHFKSTVYFELFNVISEFYNKHQQIPFYDEIELIIKTSAKYNDTTKKTLLVNLKTIYELKNDVSYSIELVEQAALNFIKTQNLLIVAKKLEELAHSGQYANYDNIVEELIVTISDSDVEENHYITSAGNYDDLSEPRIPIPLGWGEGFNKSLNGGLARGELLIGIAGSGVGKTTLATINGDYNYMLGLNVVQVFFEDTKQQLRQKQRARWTGLPINQITKNQREDSLQYIKKTSDEKISKANEKGGTWILKKFKSTGTTVNDLRKYLNKLKTQYKITPHVVIIDYLECFDVTTSYSDDWKKEKEITRHLESIASEDEFNVAMIAFTQGTRGAVNNEIVDVTEMGGDFAKYKIGHVVVSFAKTREMKRQKLANAAILKSRVGADGIVFKNFLFDNSTMKINITPQSAEDIVEGEVTDNSRNFATKK